MDTSSLERLTARDLELLARAGGEAPDRLRSAPGRVDGLIASAEVFDLLFAPWSEDPLVLASPFLVFSTLLARTAVELGEAPFILEWMGPNQRLPVFEVEGVRAFAADPQLRVFLAELLASYSHVVSGTMWVRSDRGWTRRRFSELDPARMAELADLVPERERPTVLRRLGDIAMFLAGIFPDHSEQLFRPVQLDLIRRAAGQLQAGGKEEQDAPGVIGLLERLGRSSYRRAWRDAPAPWRRAAAVLPEVAERFGYGRRVLNLLADRFLYPRRQEWFSAG